MNNISKEVKALVFSVFILTGLFFSSIVFGAGLLDFGGRISTMVECVCSEGSQVSVVGMGRNTKFSGTYLYLPGVTRIKGKGNVTPGRNIIGKYSSGGTCLIGEAPYCTTLPISKGTMQLIKTN